MLMKININLHNILNSPTKTNNNLNNLNNLNNILILIHLINILKQILINSSIKIVIWLKINLNYDFNLIQVNLNLLKIFR